MKLILKKNIPNLQASMKFCEMLYTDYLRGEDNFTLFLEGGLGAGKTFFIREILRQFGVTDEVSSPTYIFHNEYTGGDRTFSHFDMYRMNDPQEFFARGMDQIAEDDKVSKFVEWPEKISPEERGSFSGKKLILKIGYGVGASMRTVKLLEY